MEAFIREFRMTNEILFKERNNLLSELRIEVHGLLKVIDNAHISRNEVKGVTTRGGKTTTEGVHNDNISNDAREPLALQHDKPIGPNDVLVKKRKRGSSATEILRKSKATPYQYPVHRSSSTNTKIRQFFDRCSAVLLNKLPSNEKYTWSFTIPCHIGKFHINNAFADLGASISLMPYTMYEKLGLGEPKPIRMSLELADRHVQYRRRIVENVLIKVDKFIFSIDFVILDMPGDSRILIILGIPFLETARAMIDVFNKKITLRVGDDEKTKESDGIKNEHLYSASANKIDEKKPELKDLPSHLEYAYLHGNESFPIIISSKLYKEENKSLLHVSEKRKGAISWKMSDIKGISLSFYTHKILMEDDFKPVIQPQRHLYPKVQDVVKDEIVKLLDSGLIYPISDNPWVSPIHVVPKKKE
ncbi:DNA-directed DNA polymerase [Tanacetum coccineum]